MKQYWGAVDTEWLVKFFSEEVRSEGRKPYGYVGKSFPDRQGGANALGLIHTVCSIKSRDLCAIRVEQGESRRR